MLCLSGKQHTWRICDWCFETAIENSDPGDTVVGQFLPFSRSDLDYPSLKKVLWRQKLERVQKKKAKEQTPHFPPGWVPRSWSMAGTRIKFIRVELRFKFVSSRDGFSTESLADFFVKMYQLSSSEKNTWRITRNRRHSAYKTVVLWRNSMRRRYWSSCVAEYVRAASHIAWKRIHW